MARKAFITKGKSKGSFAIRTDDGQLNDLDDISFDDFFGALADELDEQLTARGYTKSRYATPRLDSLTTPEAKALWEQRRLSELEESRKFPPDRAGR